MFLVTWLLNLTYVALLTMLAPVLLFRAVRQGKYRDGLAEKLFGYLPTNDSEQRPIWLHAVSVGEVLQLEPVLHELRQRYPDGRFLITTTTRTGRDVAESRFAGHQVTYFPLDFSWAVRRALKRVRPSAVVLVELELWPNFILETHRQGIPLSLINGRLSDRSFRGYGHIRALVSRLLTCFDCLAVQTPEYADRFRQLGADAGRVHVTGSIKFDRVETDRDNPRTRELRRFFRLSERDRIFIAGSTQPQEEQFAIDAWLSARQQTPRARLILVPRHRERFDEVAEMVVRQGLSVLRRTQTVAAREHPTDDPDCVLLLDTLGELSACWGLADVAFVGGSLVPGRGGQNMIEPAAYGAAVVVGPHTDNFRDIVRQMRDANAMRVVEDVDEFRTTIGHLLAQESAAAELGANAVQLIATQTGAVGRTIDVIGDAIGLPVGRSESDSLPDAA